MTAAAVAATTRPLLELSGIDTFYGQIHILQGLSLRVQAGELVCLLGGNASGKSTTLKTILGIVRPRNGIVRIDGEDVTKRPTSYRIGRGLAIVPENRRLFAPMTVLENLELGAYLRGGGVREDYERIYELFPLLYERRSQLAGTLSGGEQQMVAMGRALMSRPKLLLMDEPSMGLAPILVERNFEIIEQVHESGVALLIVEQNANVSLSIADRGYVLYERRSQLAGTLSGGEQQMVAMGRALMSRPKLLLMDEPSMGLAPILVERNFEIIEQVHESGVALLIVEQNANVSLSIADRGYVLSTGRLVLEGAAADLRENEDLRKAYLGR